MSKFIDILGAKEHNLKNVSLKIPKNKLVVITGVSGSGKSSLAFDTIQAEGQRRFLDTLSNYAKQFAGSLKRPEVEKIAGLSPVVSIEQKTISRSPRSTVGTITEVYDFLRLLYARIGQPYSYITGSKMIQFSEEKIIHLIKKSYDKKKILLLSPLVKSRKGHYRELFSEYKNKGYSQVRVDGKYRDLQEKISIERYTNHDIELVVDKILVGNDEERLSKSLQFALKLGSGTIMIHVLDENKCITLSKNIVCPDTGLSYNEPSPNTFSFNSPYGYCMTCKGIGTKLSLDVEKVCPNKNLTFNEGAFKPLVLFTGSTITEEIRLFITNHKVSLDTPIKKYPKGLFNLLLFGDNNQTDNNNKKEKNKTAYEEMLDYINKKKQGKSFKGLEYYMRRAIEISSPRIVFWAKTFFSDVLCTECNGSRLDKISIHYKIDNHSIFDLAQMSLSQLQTFFNHLTNHLTNKEQLIVKDLLIEIQYRLHFLNDIGLGYLTLNRMSGTLSGGEAQRIRLATQISSKLQSITFILDEPSIGLHSRDNNALISALKKLRDAGNSVLVVEHDKEIMLQSDYLIDIGPDAGVNGGKIVFEGTAKNMLLSESITADYLSGKKVIKTNSIRRKGNGHSITIKGASGNNLKHIDVTFDLGKLIVVTGVSGSGKSSLVIDTLYPILASHCKLIAPSPLPYKIVENIDNINKVIDIDQTPIGRTSRSNPATYCGFFSDIRQIFANLPESKVRGYKMGRFSFNVKGGRCEECQGGGYKNIEMNFLPDVEILCPVCTGKRYNRETLDIHYNGKNINQILDMNVDEAVDFFKRIPYLHRKLKVLQNVRLGYLKIGQSSLTLSGGEAQRIKLASELTKKDTGKTFYILDEPTTGLHFQDIENLINVLNRLVDKGNTVVVIEHNMDVIYTADQVIDMGYNGGEEGGKLLFEGTPEDLAKHPNSLTGKYLHKEIELRHKQQLKNN